MDERKPAFWAVIPANVLFSQELRPNAKLLFGVVTLLQEANGYCYASNRYLASLFGLQPDTITGLLGNLEDAGLIATDVVRDEAAGADTLILEANHDIKMLQSGAYPELLKRRILSTRGHLSNESAGWLLAKLPQLPENIILAHLSEENNLPQLAVETVQNIFDGCRRSLDARLLVAAQNNIVTDF